VGDEVTKRLREQVGSMTTRDWLVRVCELRQAIESRDCVISEPRRTIERPRRLLDPKRARVARLEAEQARTGAPKKSREKHSSKADPGGGASSRRAGCFG
jgi:hypothetical protein